MRLPETPRAEIKNAWGPGDRIRGEGIPPGAWVSKVRGKDPAGKIQISHPGNSNSSATRLFDADLKTLAAGATTVGVQKASWYDMGTIAMSADTPPAFYYCLEKYGGK